MSFDGILLNKLINEFNILKTGRISKITESGDTDFIFTIRANRINYNLMMSFSSDFARIHITTKFYDTVMNPKSFTMFLRKHIEGYFIEDIKTYDCDRIIYFVLSGYNEMQDLNKKYLICEVMGRYSNMILTNEDFLILDSLKHDGIGEYNRTILPNAIYEFPKTNKLNPLDYTKEEIIKIFEDKKPTNPKEVMAIFNGVSLNISYPIFTKDYIAEAFYDLIHSEINPATFINFKGSLDFYYNPFDYKIEKTYSSISELLDNYYYQADLKAKVKLKTNDLSSFVNKQINKFSKKIEKLEAELLLSDKNEEIKIEAELLLSIPNLKEKKSKVSVFNYYTNEYQEIKLDSKITILENSNKLYKKYQKAKASISHILEQIEIAKSEIDYFKILKYQLTDCTINEALEIQDELILNKYLFKQVQVRKKNQKPRILTFIVNDYLISVGKNNIQNEYITHKLSKPNDLWFHVKNAEGSHVVLHNCDNPTEEEIRACANLAAFYSTYKESSSVAVDYTKIKYIKKIPGKRNCFVTYTHQHTIYIDPNEDDIMRLKVKK